MARRNGAFSLPSNFVHECLFLANNEAKHALCFRVIVWKIWTVFDTLPARDGLWEAVMVTQRLARQIGYCPACAESTRTGYDPLAAG